MLLNAADINFVRNIVFKRSGNVLGDGHNELLESRLNRVAKDCGMRGVVELVGSLRSGSTADIVETIVDAVTINETRFFRDHGLFETLRTSVIPALIVQNKTRRAIRIWSAACSSGQEPYSIAMLIRENFPELDEWDVRIVATDISDAILKRSQAGLYSQFEVNNGLPEPLLHRYFRQCGEVWQAKSQLRNMIDHRRLNLMDAWPFVDKFDLVFIRNILIYFDRTTKAEVLQRVNGVLYSNGYLFIGAAESLIGLNVPYRLGKNDGSPYYRPTTG